MKIYNYYVLHLKRHNWNKINSPPSVSVHIYPDIDDKLFIIQIFNIIYKYIKYLVINYCDLQFVLAHS